MVEKQLIPRTVSIGQLESVIRRLSHEQQEAHKKQNEVAFHDVALGYKMRSEAYAKAIEIIQEECTAC